MNIPRIQIRQQPAKIGMDITPGQYQMKQPKADVNMQREPAKLDIRTTEPQLKIDSSRAWAALGKRPPLELMDTIYGKTDQIVHDYIAKIAQRGDRLAAIHQKQDPIPEFGLDTSITFHELYYEGETSYDNVDIQFTPGDLDIRYEAGRVNIDVMANKPEIDYQRGKVDIYLRQRNSLEIIPPKIDTKM